MRAQLLCCESSSKLCYSEGSGLSTRCCWVPSQAGSWAERDEEWPVPFRAARESLCLQSLFFWSTSPYRQSLPPAEASCPLHNELKARLGYSSENPSPHPLETINQSDVIHLSAIPEPRPSVWTLISYPCKTLPSRLPTRLKWRLAIPSLSGWPFK